MMQAGGRFTDGVFERHQRAWFSSHECDYKQIYVVTAILGFLGFAVMRVALRIPAVRRCFPAFRRKLCGRMKPRETITRAYA
jgi:hypothetical protein